MTGKIMEVFIMGMVVRTNTMSANAYRQLGANNNQLSKSLEKLSSGFRINRAGDDSSGLAISEKMKAQIAGLDQASANSQDGISLVQTAEGALTEVHSMLNRMVELANKSANGTIQDNVDRDAIQTETDALKDEITRISKSTNFNGITLLNGSLGGYNGTNTAAGGIAAGDISVSGGNLANGDSIEVTVAAATGISITKLGTNLPTGITFNTTAAPEANGTYTFTAVVDKAQATAENADKYEGLTISVKMGSTPADGAAVFTVAEKTAGKGDIGGSLKLQVGDTNEDHNQVKVNVDDMSAKGLGIADLKVDTQKLAGESIQTIKDAINKVSTNRGKLGALQNRLEHAISNLNTTSENMDAANSAIRDTDMAKEMMNYTKMNILSQAAQAMLAQANQQPQNILQLLK